MMLALMLSCGDSATTGEKQDENPDVDNEPAEDEKANVQEDPMSRQNIQDSLPDGLDFGGAQIRILHRDDIESWRDEIKVEEEIGEIVNDALYHRNKNVEERLNVGIESISTSGGWSSRNSFLSTIRNSVNAGSDDYDFIAGYAYYMPSIAPEGLLYNLNEINYLQPDADWWSESCARETAIDGKLFFITGDLAHTLLRNTIVTYFNKKIAQDLGVDNLYQIVSDGDFTVDKIIELTKDMYRDLNGNGIRDKDDMYGFAMTTGVYVDGLFNAFDQKIIKKDSDGIPQFVLNSPRMIEIIEGTYDFFYNTESVYAISEYDAGNEESIITMFIEDRLLFMPGTLSMHEELRAMESDYGILPYMKWNKEQPGYYTTSKDSYSLFCVPVTCTKLDAVGATMEAMCAESYRTVTPAYFEIALKQKYSRDEETSRMLDLIRDGITFDFGTLNSINLSDINKIFRDLMTEKRTDFVSRYERSEARYQNALDRLLEAYQNLP
jgi:hypothetical protein